MISAYQTEAVDHTREQKLSGAITAQTIGLRRRRKPNTLLKLNEGHSSKVLGIPMPFSPQKGPMKESSSLREVLPLLPTLDERVAQSAGREQM